MGIPLGPQWLGSEWVSLWVLNVFPVGLSMGFPLGAQWALSLGIQCASLWALNGLLPLGAQCASLWALHVFPAQRRAELVEDVWRLFAESAPPLLARPDSDEEEPESEE